VSFRIVPVAAADAEILAGLFAQIRSDAAATHFHPHPFTDDEARTRAAYRGSDFYALMFWGEDAIGYGFLRGWDEGYETPSLGIYVAQAHRGTGAARTLMDHLHREARLRGAQAVRIRVQPGNARALGLYRKLGYRFLPETEAGQLVGLLERL